jgi:mono/diheme cytochrome c family protein
MPSHIGHRVVRAARATGTTLAMGFAVLVLASCGERAASNAHVPEGSLGIGQAASDSLIASMNTDIGEDGSELPVGQGSVADGAKLYAAQCAACHGVNGEGAGAALPALNGRSERTDSFQFANDPALVKTVTNYWPHATTLFDYIKRAMPLTAPGSLTDDQVYALTAYILAKDRIIADTATLDAASLRQVRMPARDRFVPDDRTPGLPVR